MDIVGRIQFFLNEKNITVSQFADGCGIKRPTMSQLMNGRNKKVSDEIISKIHSAFPALSISWLLFGEGDMMLPQVAENTQPRENSIFDYNLDDDKESVKLAEESKPEKSIYKSADNVSAMAVTATNMQHPNVKLETIEVEKPKRSVTKIIVYYSDNSFEEFVPR